MPLTLRPFSANTYALSKVWFKCSSVNLRNQDIDSINSQVKSWLYQDCLEKPSELVLYRNTQAGGLGLFHVKIRSLALLIRSFLETASNPKFRHSLLHEVLFRYHVLGETCLPNPGFLPYYDQNLFNTIKHYQDTCPLNISVMTTKQWYQILLEDRVFMQPGAAGAPQVLLPFRVELLCQSKTGLPLGHCQEQRDSVVSRLPFCSSSSINSSPTRTESTESPMSLVSVRSAMLPQKICTMLSSAALPVELLLTCFSAMSTQ